ncbi:BAG family molecular chaperone regulator like [Actinidia chinensis var. chinensis]|uniref:BAG family molecular chaperone regulator like n=1 Tax=Actinidia chinensis var. chinensis TaxID=1590841 RepID=A0A2R6P6C0_ACTCC|nr:BAG family molecular chaperone regulator like [Actinidia chinensis var. chinensis]
MKRSSTTSKKGVGVGVNKSGYKNSTEEVIIDWELRPGGMLVQKRVFGCAGGEGGAMIKIKVSHGSYHHDISVPAQSTFGELKGVLANETGLDSKDQRLLFRGKERGDDECLHMVGVIDMSKVILLEDPARKARKLEEMERNQYMLKAYEAVANVRLEVDKLSNKVVALERAVQNGTEVADKEFVVLTELLMVQLLKLDAIEADGEAKVQRRIEVRRVQSFVDALDNLKARKANPFSNGVSSGAVLVTAKWETFDSGVGSLSAPKPRQSSTNITRDWELFD